jgi:hypothetical protein
MSIPKITEIEQIGSGLMAQGSGLVLFFALYPVPCALRPQNLK